MKERLNYQTVPSTKAEDCNPEFTTWRDGRCVAIDEGTHVTLYVGHRRHTVMSTAHNDSETEPDVVTLAFGIRVAKPVTRDMAINAAEMSAYKLGSAMEVASFNASLGRKHRADADDAEVKEHDEFIEWVKDELTAIGV